MSETCLLVQEHGTSTHLVTRVSEVKCFLLLRETPREEKHRKNWVFPYIGRKQPFFLTKYTAVRVRISGFRSDSALHQQWCVPVGVI